MAQPVVVQQAQPYYFDESYSNPISVANDSSMVKLCSIRCRTGLQPWLTGYAQQIDPAGVDYVTWHLYRNGNPLSPFHSHKNQTSAPQDNVRLPVPLRLEQDDLIEVYAQLDAGAGGALNAAARILVEYTDLGS